MKTRTATCIFTLAVASCFGQEAKPADPPDAVFRTESSLVELHTTVTDLKGKLLTNLPESAFQVFENEVRQKVAVFRQEDAPVSLDLIIDNSESMRPKRAQIAAAALTLVRSSNPEDEVFLVNFNETPTLVADFTRDISTLETALRQIDSTGATAMRDALELGINHLKRMARHQKKVVLIITDGQDNSSSTTQATIIRDAQQSGVLIYSVGLLADADTRERERAHRELDSITLTTGGEVFYPTVLEEVAEIAHHIASDLRLQYTIAYRSSNPSQDGTYRKIRLELVGQPPATVKTREGYYATSGPT